MTAIAPPSAAARSAGEPLVLNEDRYFDSDPAIRRAARELHEGMR